MEPPTPGEDHPDVAACYNGMGNAYNDKGDYDEALQYYGKALQIRLKALVERRGLATYSVHSTAFVHHFPYREGPHPPGGSLLFGGRGQIRDSGLIFSDLFRFPIFSLFL